MTDILIIGSGPAGMTAAVYAGRAGFDVMIAEKEYMGTGQIAQSIRVENYPGFKSVSGYDLAEAMREQAEAVGVKFCEGEAVKLSRCGSAWECIIFDDGTGTLSKTVIYAAGCRYKTLDIPGEKELIGRRVHFCALCDGAFYEGKTVAVIGGGGSAVNDAVCLSGIAKKVYVIYRGKALKAAPIEVSRLETIENVEVIYERYPESFEESEGRVYVVTNEKERIETDGIFLAVGMVPETELLKDLIFVDSKGYVPAPEICITEAPGLFVAGDIRAKSLRQVVTACADGDNAAFSAGKYLRSQYIDK